MLWQLDRYVEDQALLVRRKLTAHRREDRRSRAPEGSRAHRRGARQARIEAIQTFRHQMRHLEDRIAKLERGDDPDYQLWRNRLHERRFRRPQVHRVLEVEFEIAREAAQPC